MMKNNRLKHGKGVIKLDIDYQKFEDLVMELENRYRAPKLKIKEYALSNEQLGKVRFDEEDIHFEVKQDVSFGLLLVPSSYEESLNLPLLGNKFIRYSIDYHRGPLFQITVESGYWKLKNHDMRYKEYVVELKNTVHLNYWFEQKRWAFIKKEDWLKMYQDMQQDLNQPILRQLELAFADLLDTAAKVRHALSSKQLTPLAKEYISILRDLSWYIERVPKLWFIFNVYSKDMYYRILNRLNNLHKWLDEADAFIYEKEKNHDPIAKIDEENTPLYLLDSAAEPLLLEGYEVFNNSVTPSLQTIFTHNKPFETHANNQTLKDYETIALDISRKKKKTFVWMNEVKAQYYIQKR